MIHIKVYQILFLFKHTLHSKLKCIFRTSGDSPWGYKVWFLPCPTLDRKYPASFLPRVGNCLVMMRQK